MIIVGDLHFDNPDNYNWVGQDGKVINLVLEVAYLSFRWVCETAEIGEDVLVLGDIFEKKDKIPSAVKNELVKVLRLFKKKDCRLYFLVGNHDKNKEGDLTIEFLAKSYGKVIRKIKLVNIDNYKVLFIPHKNRDEEALQVLDMYRNQDVIVCSHVDIEGADLGRLIHKGDDLFKEEDFSGYKMVFNGHYHKGQMIKEIICVGSLYKTHWVDMWDKVIYRVNGNKVKRIKVPDFLGREIVKIKTEKDIDELKDKDLSDKIVRYDIEVMSGVGQIVERLKNEVKTKMYFINWTGGAIKTDMDSDNIEKIDSKLGLKQYIDSVLKEEVKQGNVRDVYEKIIMGVM
jgi:DNA repair exonuclease SbcCD nuclease subunit